MTLYRDWVCRACGERGDEATDPPSYLAPGFTCLTGEVWFDSEYPEGMKHHWSDGTPLSLADAAFWWAAGRLSAVGSAVGDEPSA